MTDKYNTTHEMPLGDEEYNPDAENVVLPGVNDLPAFASLEARKIDKDNKVKEIDIDKIATQIDDMTERVKVMKEHFKNVQQEVDHTNQLQGAKQAEIDAENHLYQLTSRTLGRGQTDAKKVQSEIDFVKEQLNLVQSQIYKANEQMDEFKMQMNWNQEELEQWALAAKQKEDDLLTIEKYKRSDEQKIKDLSWELEILSKNYLAVKAKLENEATDTLAKQMELDRVAQDFKVAHSERQAIVNRWQDTIGEMKKRDKEINELGERFAIAKVERTKKEAQYKQQRERLGVQQFENKEVEARAEMISRIVLRKREELMIGTTKLNEFRGELESLKNELTTAAENLVQKRHQNTTKTNALEEQKVQLERERQKYQVAKVKIEKAKDSNVKAEMKAKEAEDYLLTQEKELTTHMLAVKTLKEKLIKENQYAYELKSEENRLRSEISGNRSIGKNLEGQLNALDKEAARQQELLYNAEFQIQQIERKIARGMGERSDEEKQVLKKSIDGLEHQLEVIKEKRKMLSQQNRKLNNELASLKNRKEELTEKYTLLTESLHEKELENSMMEDEIKSKNKDYEELSVTNDLLLLEVRRLKDVLSSKSDVVYSLENRKQQLLLSMEERKQEIAIQRDLLRAELKVYQDDKHRIMMECNTRKQHVDKLKARYEASHSANDNDERHSQAYYVIKAAQKREELQRTGDTLDQDIRRCEKEIRALQTTLDHLNARNVAFRESFQKIDIKGDDADVLVQLEERIKLTKEQLFRKKKDVQRLTTDYDEDMRRLDQVNVQYEKIYKQVEHLSHAKVQVEDELNMQGSQLQDLQDRMQKVIQKHHTKHVEVQQQQGNTVDMEKIMTAGTLEEKMVRSEVVRDVVQVRMTILCFTLTSGLFG